MVRLSLPREQWGTHLTLMYGAGQGTVTRTGHFTVQQGIDPQLEAILGYGVEPLFGLTSIDVEVTAGPQQIVAFGDSITQIGDSNRRFHERLLETAPGSSTVRNLGIGGNRLLEDAPMAAPAYGRSGLHRFETSAFGNGPVDAAIIAIGINDLALPQMIENISTEVVSTAELKAGFAALAKRSYA